MSDRLKLAIMLIAVVCALASIYAFVSMYQQHHSRLRRCQENTQTISNSTSYDDIYCQTVQ